MMGHCPPRQTRSWRRRHTRSSPTKGTHLHVTTSGPTPHPRCECPLGDWQPHQQGLATRRHLLCCLKRLTEGPRVPTPEGSRPGFPRGDVATPVRPVTGRPSLPPSLLYLLPCQVILRLPLLWSTAGQQAYHVPQVEHSGWFRPRLSAGGAPSAPGEFGAPGPDHVPFWPKPVSIFGLSWVTTFSDASPGLAMPPYPRPRPP
jgi:hypothetical protein